MDVAQQLITPRQLKAGTTREDIHHLRAFVLSITLVLVKECYGDGTSMERTIIAAADSLAEALFGLAEPWRSRFLAFLADRATRWAWNGRLPTLHETASWLGDDDLYEAVALMFLTWQGARARTRDFVPIH